jgi:hypothetical protein
MKMDKTILLWVISVLLGVIGFFVQNIWRDVKDMKKDIKKRTLILDCEKTHREVDNYLHHHAIGGTPAGEVVKK